MVMIEFWTKGDFSTGGKKGGDVGESINETVPAREKDRCSAPAGQTREGDHQEEPNHPREAVWR